jgi:lipoprotein-anchoring transpeptidase ErfK/SrfK
MTNKIVSVLLGMLLFLLPTANATTTLNFSNDEISNYIDSLTLNTYEATFGQTIDIGLTTKKSVSNISLSFTNSTNITEVTLEKVSDHYFSGKMNVTSSFTKGIYQLTSIKLNNENLNLAEKKIAFKINDLPVPTINKVSNLSTSINGVFLPNSKVQISVNNRIIKSLTTDINGKYSSSIKPFKELTKISVTGISGGIKSKTTILSVSDASAPRIRSISPVSDQTQAIFGKSEPTALVKVYANKILLGQGTVNSSGNFNVKIAKQKANSLIEAIVVDKSNNQSKPLAIRVADKTAPMVPSIHTIKENATVISGKTDPNASVKLYLNNRYINKTTANTKGDYFFKVGKLKAFTDVKVIATDLAGNQSKPTLSMVNSNQPLSNGQLLIINTKINKLSYYNKGKLVKTFSVATGKSSTPTPTGKFKILNRIVNRPWYKENIPGGSPNNPLGKRWMGLSVGASPGNSYGIHGNNNESSIGKSVSNGCIRMHNSEIQWLFDQVKVGTTVIIAKTSNSNGQIAHSYGLSIVTK